MSTDALKSIGNELLVDYLPHLSMAWSNSYRVPSTAINEGIWAFDIGARLFGIPIRFHYTLFLLLFIEVFAAGLSYAEQKFVLLLFVLLGPILIVTVLLVRLFTT